VEHLDQIRRCVGGNACIDWGLVETVLGNGAGKRGLCVVNPIAGREVELATVFPAATRKKVVVVGGGLAGLETARLAAERGHEVILLEKRQELGGLVNIAARAPTQEILL